MMEMDNINLTPTGLVNLQKLPMILVLKKNGTHKLRKNCRVPGLSLTTLNYNLKYVIISTNIILKRA